ncbi:MAG: hypothetical protein CME71_09050 [Halobacteriovorax sp.]|nr:hypothetical protein [Halobacteriovorax sp.]
MKNPIYYYGKSKDAPNDFKRFLDKKGLSSDYSLEHFESEELDFFPEQLDRKKNYILIIDEDYINENILYQVLKIRQSALSPYFTIGCIIGKSEDLERKSYWMKYGINLIAANDGDLLNFLIQLLYLASDGLIPIQRFAETRNTHAKAIIDQQVYLNSVNQFNATLSSDIDVSVTKDLIVRLQNSAPLQLKTCTKASSPASGAYSQFETTWDLPQESAWGEKSSEFLNWDTLKTQLDFNFKAKSQRPRRILIICQISTYVHYLKTKPNDSHGLQVSQVEYTEDRFEHLMTLEWDAIILGDTPSLSPDERYDFSFSIIDACKASKRDCLLFITESVSKSEAVRKVTRYEKVITSPDKLSGTSLSTVLPALSKPVETGVETYVLDHYSKYTNAFIQHSCLVTCLSEFFVIFATNAKIPAKSIFSLDIGFKLPLIIVKPIRELERIGDKTQYMGFIFGLKEEQLQTLRQAVNYYLQKEVLQIDNNFLKPVIEATKVAIIEPAKPELTATTEQKTELTDTKKVKTYYTKH